MPELGRREKGLRGNHTKQRGVWRGKGGGGRNARVAAHGGRGISGVHFFRMTLLYIFLTSSMESRMIMACGAQRE